MKKLIFTLSMAFIAITVLNAVNPVSVTFNPTADGFVKQLDGLYDGTTTPMELSGATGLNHDIFLDFDLTSMTITPKHATLKVYVNSVDTAKLFIVSAYGKVGNAIDGNLTFANRPVDGQRCVDIHSGLDSVGKWLQFDVSDFVKAQDFTTNKLLSFRIAVPTTKSPLTTIGSIESVNKPQLILSDAPIPGVYEVPFSVINSFTPSVASTAEFDPKYAFNGAGLLPGMFSDTGGNIKQWRNTTASSSGAPISLIVKLNDAITIKKFHIWNFNWMSGTAPNQTNYTNRGIKSLEIYVSTTTDNMATVTDFTDSRWTKVSATGLTLTQADGTVTYAGEDVAVTSVDNARWFAFKELITWGGSTGYTGLSEVKIYKEIKVSGPTGIENTFKSNIVISSNNGVLSIDNISPESIIELYNLQGQLIRNVKCIETKLQFQVPVGVYVIKANGDNYKALVK
jgi:hypothetical protein